MKNKINGKLAAIAILAIVATAIGITTVYYNLFQRQVRTGLSISTRLLREAHYFDSRDIDLDRIDLAKDINELRVSWIDGDGTVLYDNDVTEDKLTNHRDRPEIQDAIAHGVGESVRESDTVHKNTFYYAILLDNGTILRVATDAESIWSIFVSAAPMIALIIVCIIAVCILISHILTKQLVRPIETMAQNLGSSSYEAPYTELEPFAEMIHRQHADILSAAKARQDFTANVSHELKTPLTSISGYSELLENGMAGEDQQQHFLQEIRKNANRLLLLINDIIRLSELDRIEKTPPLDKVDLCETVSECMDELDMNARQRGVSLSFEGTSCIIRGNKDMLKELTENLVQNAIRYNNKNGKVEIRVEQRPSPVLIVKDNGIGIPEADQGRIFERFYRVDKSRSKATGGTGLGLAIVKHIVEIHGARIELDSAPGVGTTVSVIF